MRVGKVIGTVVATRKEESLVGYKLLVVEELDPHNHRPTGDCVVAVDTLGAGVCDTVLFVEGSGARVNQPEDVPTDAAVVGIIDTVDIEI